ncbi:hypothetical protein [Sulfuricystis multivorans]|uniref:hypothetical protein n=1 Tax=Sulfuricystis multivorans TaxID=2211108 RepID=UPI000F83DC7C|nr:hypothetical protein [Sulfuricystis multivorans]
MNERLFPTWLALLVLVGCSATPNPPTPAVANAIIPNKSIDIGPSVSYPLEKLVYWGLYIGAAWLIVDPLAPNWEIEEARLPDDYVHFSLKMKRIYSGGAGEARAVLDRRAKVLVREGGYRGYELVEYAERLDSSVLGSQRKAEGVIRLIKKAG